MIAGILTIAATARRPAAGSSRADHSETGRRYRLADRLCHRPGAQPGYPSPPSGIQSADRLGERYAHRHLEPSPDRPGAAPSLPSCHHGDDDVDERLATVMADGPTIVTQTAGRLPLGHRRGHRSLDHPPHSSRASHHHPRRPPHRLSGRGGALGSRQGSRRRRDLLSVQGPSV
jgi:hypothetical protein